VRRYLVEFLSDPRVVDAPRWLWLPLLRGVIAPVRSFRSARAYRKVWMDQGSPLRVLSERLCRGVAQELEGSGVRVALAMRYGEPSVASAVAGLGPVSRLVVLPLYPQYSGTTTASVFDAVALALRARSRLPNLRFVREYDQDPAYLDALADSVRAHRAGHGAAEHLLCSFHGIPERYVRAGDPYADQCQRTVLALAERLGLGREQCSLSYQSRVGREPWLGPDTESRLVELARSGTRRVEVICPGFAVDCLETLEEIALRAAERFREAGGERLDYIPALNDTPAHAALLAQLIRRHGGIDRAGATQSSPRPELS
jgi:ferrochelatase